MKIALVKRRYNPFGGAELFLDQFLQLLVAKNHEVHLFTHHWKKNRYSRDAFVLHPVSVEEKTAPFFQMLSFSSDSERLLKQNRFDVIHGFERCPFLDLYQAVEGCHRAWLTQQAKNDKSLAHLKQDMLHQVTLALERQIFTNPRTQLIVCNSLLVKRQIQKYYDVPDKKLRVHLQWG